MTRYEIEALFENQLAIMKALNRHDSQEQSEPLNKRIKETKELIDLLHTQGSMGRQ